MNQIIITTKTIILFPILFLIMLVINFVFNYYDSKNKMYDFVQRQAQTLNSFMIVHRNYYQKLYLNKTIHLTEKTLSGLPAFSAFNISKTFSEQNTFNISVQTVSDKARNEKNQADQSELKAMDFFNKDKEQKEYFNNEGDFFQYATPLYIKKKCLACHGPKDKAPKFIAKRYANAYDYKVGDLRGIVSIKIPKKGIAEYFTNSFVKGVIFDFVILLIILAISSYLVKYFRNLSQNLELEVQDKTKELSKNIAFLESHKIAMEESSIVSISDLDGKITYVNDKFCTISGYSSDEVLGKPHSILRHPDNNKEIFEELKNTIRAKKVWKGTLKSKGKENDFWADISIVPILDENNDIFEYIYVRHDITQVIKQKEQLSNIANTDALTGFGNRYKLNNDIKTSIQPALAIINIDNFSQINDFYGHEAGDDTISKLGNIISVFLEDKNCELYHLQGDEYVVFNPNISQQIFIDNINKLSDTISKTAIEIEGEKLILNISTSISFEAKDKIFTTADMALKIAKKEHHDMVIYSDEISLNDAYKNNIIWTKKIKKAIEDDKIIPFFQPIVNNSTGAWEKYEALVRLKDEDDKIISPYFFLDISKQTKYYIQITKIMIEKSFEAFKDKDVEFSLNITIEDILNKDIKDFLYKMLEQYNIGNRLVLEIVESESIENFVEISNFIAEVKRFGCKIAIDDFGTGYSNFEYLLKLNSDYIKIDGSMIKDIDTNSDAKLVVSTIVDFAKKMNIKTIAEFVENEAIEKIVKELGIDYSQGYLHSAPQPTIRNNKD